MIIRQIMKYREYFCNLFLRDQILNIFLYYDLQKTVTVF